MKDDDGYSVLELYDDDAALQNTHAKSALPRCGSEIRWFDGRTADDDALRSHRIAEEFTQRVAVLTVLVKQIRQLIGHRAA